MSRFEHLFTSDNVKHLQSTGFFYCDQIFDEKEAIRIREELLSLDVDDNTSTTARLPTFKEHLFQFAGKLYPKPHIYEIDLHDAALRQRSATLEQIYRVTGPALVSAAHIAFPDLDLDPTSASAIKVQLNKGGSFPCHYDNPGPPNKRCLTCIVYLNAEWNDSFGGQLELMPFLKKKVTVQPLMNRMVVFRSDLVLHGVAPWKVPKEDANRLCFTVWIDALTQGEYKLTRKHLQFVSWDSAATFFSSSTLQRCISRAVYDEEYEETLIRCVGGTPAEAPMLAQHKHHVQALLSQLRPLIEEFRRRKAETVFS
jgi:Rps23 Pro-64 3,4-dihydroxylase Tpa1-like proline 4-hydroxylase